MKKVLFLFGVAFLLIMGCTQIPPEKVDNGELLSIELSGGKCSGPCLSRNLNISNSGAVVENYNYTDYKHGILSKEDLDALTALVETTDYDGLREKKFTGDCPTASDGLKRAYSFYTSKGVQKIDGCETKVDSNDPLVKFINDLLKKYTYDWRTKSFVSN